MKIGINCGHTISGQPGCGAVGYLDESVTTREVGNELINIFKSNGHTVVNCTNDYATSTNANLQAIVNLANKQPLDLFVSIHFNAGGGTGTEVYTYGGNSFPEAERTVKNISDLGLRNRGIKDGSNLYVIRHTDAKAMLIETCFVDTLSDANWYHKIGPQKIAQAIYNGITNQNINITSNNENNNLEEDIDMATLDELRKKIDELEHPMIYNYVDENMPDWAKEAVNWEIEKGILKGTEKGLELTDNDLRQIVREYRFFKLIESNK